jgi:hypothetical protein
MVETAHRYVEMGREKLAEIRGGGVPLPAKVEQMLKQFLLDRKTGNVRINVKDGRVLGVHLEEIVVIR